MTVARLRIVAIGEEAKLAGYALAGVQLIDVGATAGVRDAWEALGDDVGLVLLTPEASRELTGASGRPELLRVVLPG